MVFLLPVLPELVVGVGVPLLMIGATAGGWLYVLGGTAPGQAAVGATLGSGAASGLAGASAKMVGGVVRYIPSAAPFL